MNKRNPYLKIMIEEKAKTDKNEAQYQKKKEQNEVDVNKYLKTKITGIQDEIGKFTQNVSRFATTCDEELTKLIDNLDEGQLAMSPLKGKQKTK